MIMLKIQYWYVACTPTAAVPAARQCSGWGAKARVLWHHRRPTQGRTKDCHKPLAMHCRSFMKPTAIKFMLWHR
jgi:hypothetical protein